MRSIPSVAALLAWTMLQLPGVICVCDCGDTSSGSLLVHAHDHDHDHHHGTGGDGHHSHEACGCCDHDHEQEHGDDDHGHAHVVVHFQSSLAGNALALDAPTVGVAVELPALAPTSPFDTGWERDTRPPRPADPVSAADRLIV